MVKSLRADDATGHIGMPIFHIGHEGGLGIARTSNQDLAHVDQAYNDSVEEAVVVSGFARPNFVGFVVDATFGTVGMHLDQFVFAERVPTTRSADELNLFPCRRRCRAIEYARPSSLAHRDRRGTFR